LVGEDREGINVAWLKLFSRNEQKVTAMSVEIMPNGMLVLSDEVLHQ